MRTISFLLLLLLAVASCSDKRGNYTVEVTAEGAGNRMMYLAKRSVSNTFVVDSAMPDKSGKYTLEGHASQPDFYILYLNPRNYINLIIHPGDDFKVLTNISGFDKNYIVEGSKDSRLIQKLVNGQIRTLEKITAISNRFEESKDHPEFNKIRMEIDSSYEKVFSEHRRFSLELIRNNPQSLASLMALYQQLGRNQPVFDYHKDFEVYKLVDSNLSALYPNSEAVIDLNLKVSELGEILKLEKGSQAPDIVLTDTEGNQRSLSSLQGKNILLMFWASWSTASIQEMEAFASQLKAASAKDVEFFWVSLDRTRESWLDYLTDNNIGGIHVSDLKYWDSPVVDLYHIEKLPVTYLLNKKGIILRKDFSAGEFPVLLEKL